MESDPRAGGCRGRGSGRGGGAQPRVGGGAGGRAARAGRARPVDPPALHVAAGPVVAHEDLGEHVDGRVPRPAAAQLPGVGPGQLREGRRGRRELEVLEKRGEVGLRALVEPALHTALRAREQLGVLAVPDRHALTESEVICLGALVVAERALVGPALRQGGDLVVPHHLQHAGRGRQPGDHAGGHLRPVEVVPVQDQGLLVLAEGRGPVADAVGARGGGPRADRRLGRSRALGECRELRLQEGRVGGLVQPQRGQRGDRADEAAAELVAVLGARAQSRVAVGAAERAARAGRALAVQRVAEDVASRTVVADEVLGGQAVLGHVARPAAADEVRVGPGQLREV